MVNAREYITKARAGFKAARADTLRPLAHARAPPWKRESLL